MWRAARLRLEPVDPETSRALWAIVHDPRVRFDYFLGREPSGPECWVAGTRDGRPALTLAARLSDGGALAGLVRVADGLVSYFVAPPLWGRGLGTEAVRAVCGVAAAEMRVDVLRAVVRRENLGSRRVAEAAGFLFAGLDKAADLRGRPITVLSYMRRS